MGAWATEKRMGFEEEKFQWIRMGRKEGQRRESITLPGGITKQESREIKVLGVWVDAETTWKRQVREKIANGRKMGNMIRRLGRGGRGMGVESMRTMYLATARAAMEYGAGAWWRGQVGPSNAFDKVHEQAFRKMGGHFRTAPGGAVLCKAGVQPTATRFNQKNRMRLAKALPRADHRMIEQCKERLADHPVTLAKKNRGTIRAGAEGARL